jgi:hypothetical protein
LLHLIQTLGDEAERKTLFTIISTSSRVRAHIDLDVYSKELIARFSSAITSVDDYYKFIKTSKELLEIRQAWAATGRKTGGQQFATNLATGYCANNRFHYKET